MGADETKPKGMKREELEATIDAQFQKNIQAVTEKTTAEIKAQGDATEAKINEAVSKAIKDLTLEESKKKTVRAEMMDVLEVAMLNDQAKGVTPMTSKQIFGQMLTANLKAMHKFGASDVKELGREKVYDFAKTLYPDSKAMLGLMKKDLTAGINTDGGFTVPQVLSPDIIGYLHAATILDKLKVRKVPMARGNYSYPRVDTVSSASWGGENTVISKTQPTFGEVKMSAKKLTAMTPISNTLIRENIVGLDSLIIQDLQRASRRELDDAFMYGSGVGNIPQGMKNNSDVQTSGSSSTALAVATPIDMMAKLEAADVMMDAVSWILSPIGKSWLLQKEFTAGSGWAWAKEMLTQKTLNGEGFITSSRVQQESATVSDFWLGDFSEALWGISYDMEIEMSRSGSFTSGGVQVSAFEKDLTLVRIIGEHDFALRHPKAIVYGQYKKS